MTMQQTIDLLQTIGIAALCVACIVTRIELSRTNSALRCTLTCLEMTVEQIGKIHEH